MNGIDVLKRFGFQIDKEPKSIYPFSPVYRITDKGKELIVKRTQNPIEEARKLVNYTTYLKNNGIKVVIPVDIQMDNPQDIGEETYVVYPFIEGTTYRGTDNQIFDAGKLLGQIHQLSLEDNKYELEEYDVYDFNNEEIEESVQAIEEFAKKVNHRIDGILLKEKLLQIVTQQEELKNVGLPNVATPHDYKANNLIYSPKPYLIDPDNAKWIPRIFDLALVLLLFHNELSTAPDKIFTPNQWELFLSGYKESVSLTDLEKSYWQKSIEHVFLDEVMWLMAEFEEDWDNPSQLKLFDSLIDLVFDSSKYKLN